ncbi:MAG: ankyrin repeat domain-containing protein [Micavibrio sp.]|nr:ankyrin repeat domain-containing protein [Micavibrio sp.]
MPITRQQNALMRAVKAKNVQQVKALLKQGVDTDFEDDLGRSPLEAAIAANSLPTVRALLDGGADIDRENNDTFDTPLDFARSIQKYRIATFLEDEGALSSSDKSTYGNRGSRYGSFGAFGAYDDDDDYYFDDKVKRKSSRSTRKAKTKAAAKGSSKLNEDFDNAAPPPPPKPKFTEESLKEIFNAKNWVGKPEEMQKLWDDVPKKLQKEFDFDAALAEAKRETLKKHAPQQLKLAARKPEQKPPAPKPPEPPKPQ